MMPITGRDMEEHRILACALYLDLKPSIEKVMRPRSRAAGTRLIDFSARRIHHRGKGMQIFELAESGFLDDPAPHLARLRAAGPLVRVRLPIFGTCWMTTTDAATRAMLKDARGFVRDPAPVTGRSLQRRFWWLPRAVRPLIGGLFTTDGDTHARLRGAVDAAFARTRIGDLRPDLEALADRLLDDLPDHGTLDITARYCRPLPFEAICLLLGLPAEDVAWIEARVSPVSAMESAPGAAWAFARMGRVMDYFGHRIDEVRAGTGRPGLLSTLTHEQAAHGLSDSELRSLFVVLFLAGHETTVHLLNHAIVALGRDPALRRRLVDSPGSAAPLIEELLRWSSLVMVSTVHVAARDMTFEGVRLRRGEQVCAGLLAANYDDARHAAPESLTPDRRPNAHLAFGFGPHVCLGMQMARVEAEVALTRLIARYPALSVTDPLPGWRRRVGLRVRRNLVVRLDG
jgi:cytochrome P450 PksS